MGICNLWLGNTENKISPKRRKNRNEKQPVEPAVSVQTCMGMCKLRR